MKINGKRRENKGKQRMKEVDTKLIKIEDGKKWGCRKGRKE